jgi:preprotein translocase subunit SecD
MQVLTRSIITAICILTASFSGPAAAEEHWLDYTIELDQVPDLETDTDVEETLAEVIRRRTAAAGLKAVVSVSDRPGSGLGAIKVLLQASPEITHPDHLLMRPGAFAIHRSAGPPELCDLGDLEGIVCMPQASGAGPDLPVEEAPALEGDSVAEAAFIIDQGGQPAASLTLTPSAARTFCTVTRAETGAVLALVLDGVIWSAPQVREPICGGRLMISGDFGMSDITYLMAMLGNGVLPKGLYASAMFPAKPPERSRRTRNLRQ